KQRFELYRLLGKGLEQVMARSGAPNAIHVEAHFTPEPTRAQVDAIVEQARRFDGSEPQHTFTTTDGGCQARITLIPGTVRSVPLSGDPNAFDMEEAMGSFMPTPVGPVGFEHLTVRALKAHNPKNRAEEIRKSLRHAAQQFSGDRPAIIVIDVTETVRAFTDADRVDITSVTQRFFRDNTRVSAVRLCRDVIRDIDGVPSLTRVTEEVRNPFAARPLPGTDPAPEGPTA
ncbi:MAG: hypothetical protein V4737_18075, partial [Curtobacterium sp.]